MKRKYEKPVVMVENFNMDIDILASDDLNRYWDEYVLECLWDNKEPTQQGYEEWLDMMGNDKPTSGTCYFTVRKS